MYRRRARGSGPKELDQLGWPKVRKLVDTIWIGHDCAVTRLPPEVKQTPMDLFAECPACHHPLLIHSFVHPCQICKLEERITRLEAERRG